MKYTLKITAVKWLYRDEKTGKGLLKAVTPQLIPHEVYEQSRWLGTQEFKEITCSFSHIPTPFYPVGTPLIVTGEFKESAYGYNFIAHDVAFTNPDNIPYAIVFLRNYYNQTQAKDFMEKIPYQNGSYPLFTYLAHHDSSVFHQIAELQQTQVMLSHFAPLGLTYAQASRIAKKYGLDSMTKLEQDPYRIGRDGKVSFSVMDAIAKQCDVDDFDWRRLDGITWEAIHKMENQGDCYIPLEDYAELIRRISHNRITLTELLPFAIQEKAVVEKMGDNFVIYSKQCKEEETSIFNNLMRLQRAKKRKKEVSDALIEKIEKQLDIHYSEEQKEAFRTGLNSNGVKCIIGGPGTGKTATLKGILSAFHALYPEAKIKQCAPTGRAAQRLHEATGAPASTIHRLLDYQPFGDIEICKNKNNPIDADLLIVDEMSMVDIHVFALLLNAVPTGCTVILSGDTEQLPPVGVGAVFSDILQTSDNLIPKIKFTEVFRQQENSPIVENAQRIEQGDTNLIQSDEFQIIHTHSPAETVNTLLNLVKSNPDQSNFFTSQILCPSKKGNSGVRNLNAQMQELYNPDQSKPFLRYGHKIFKQDDKIIMTRNNYEKGYYNGDMGVIRNIQDGKVQIQIGTDWIDLTRSDLEDMELAYAVTIHKSQGSEFDTIFVVLPKQPSNMLVRNLLYTAVTRAKKRVILIEEDGAMIQAIQNDKHMERRTFLGAMLQNYERKQNIA